MSTYTSRLLTFALAVASLLCAPQHMHAAELTFQSVQGAAVGGVVPVEVHIDPQSKRLNVVEGEMVFSGAASDGLFVQVENGHSLLSMWPAPPQYDADKKSVAFVGGVPGGFASEGLLFRLLLSPAVQGGIVISYTNGSGYLNDGEGTKIPISSKPLELHVGEAGAGESEYEAPSLGGSVRGTILVLVAVILFVIFTYVAKRNRNQ